MKSTASKKERAKRRHFRIRTRVLGTKDRPRLAVFRSNKHIYAQIIDDVQGKTIISSSTVQDSVKSGIKSTWTREAAKKVGELLAKSAMEKGIKKIVFDRGGNKFHGKILALAEGAKKVGLDF